MASLATAAARDVTASYGPVGRAPWLDVDWRAHQRWVRVDGQRLNVVDLGEGPPLLLIHGLSGSWPNWLEQLPVFAGAQVAHSRRVIALDLPGFGHSPLPSAGPLTIAGYARTLDGLLDALALDAAAVVGNSMGGFVAAELAINFPQRVERLALVSPAGLSTYNDPRGLRALPRLRQIEGAIAASAGWVAAHADVVARRRNLRNAALGLVTAHPGRLPAALAAEQIRGAGKPGFVQGLEASITYDFRERVREIACPTLIVWGDRDRVITVRDAEGYRELIPGARKVVFEDTGHLPMLERPAAFNALLDEFLNE